MIVHYVVFGIELRWGSKNESHSYNKTLSLHTYFESKVSQYWHLLNMKKGNKFDVYPCVILAINIICQ